MVAQPVKLIKFEQFDLILCLFSEDFTLFRLLPDRIPVKFTFS